jgi:hypothetical protein
MTPQEERELLLRVVTKLAGMRLEYGGFIPFGATVDSKREVQVLAPDSMKQEVTPKELDGYWSRELQAVVAKGAYKTVCYCAAVLAPVEDGGFIPAVLIHIEQAEADPEDLFYPYRKDAASKIIFGEPTRAQAERLVFK